MRRLPPRFLFNIVLLCLPLFAVTGAAVYFYVRDLPRWEANEKKRVRADYREIAEELKEAKDSATLVQKTRGWSSNSLFNGRMKPGDWGCFPASDTEMTVWYQEGRKCYARNTPILEETDIESVYLVGASGLLGILLILTLLGIRFFVIETYERDDFLAATAHDLTTPLVALRLLISRENEDAQQAIERLIRLVGNIKDYLRPGGRRPVFVFKEVDLLAAYKEAYKPFSLSFKELTDDEHDVPIYEDGNAPWLVRADEARLMQIIWNLLSNDLKYAAPEGAASVHLTRKGRSVAISFVDEGPGMSLYQQKRAFNRYFRARSVLKSGKGGFGIGLCTSREMARLMGGDLIVSANNPHGCIFTLTLPAAEA